MYVCTAAKILVCQKIRGITKREDKMKLKLNIFYSEYYIFPISHFSTFCTYLSMVPKAELFEFINPSGIFRVILRQTHKLKKCLNNSFLLNAYEI